MVCRYITAALIEADLLADTYDLAPFVGSGAADGGPVWLASPTSKVRRQVMAAVGILSRRLRIPAADGLKLLKAHAYALHCTTDQVAAALLAGDTPLTVFDLDT